MCLDGDLGYVARQTHQDGDQAPLAPLRCTDALAEVGNDGSSSGSGGGGGACTRLGAAR